MFSVVARCSQSIEDGGREELVTEDLTPIDEALVRRQGSANHPRINPELRGDVLLVNPPPGHLLNLHPALLPEHSESPLSRRPTSRKQLDRSLRTGALSIELTPDVSHDTSDVMKKINALQLRQSLGKVVAALARSGEPVLLEKGRKPVAVLISLRDFRERFVEKAAAEERAGILAEMDRLATASVDPTPAAGILRELRGNG
jgi:PHD/YefM family antitoxin component YafN of YafNO toxin-antitoxin module